MVQSLGGALQKKMDVITTIGGKSPARPDACARGCVADFSIEPAAPFRLDLTAWVLRRRPDNIIDRWDGGTYRRVLVIDGQPVGMAISQAGPPERPIIHVSISGDMLNQGAKVLATSILTRMLGTDIDLGGFYRLAAQDRQLGALAHQFHGVRPVRFPTLFEALVNAITCQQLSLLVGIRLLDRLTESYGPLFIERNKTARAFPGPEDLAGLDSKSLQPLGFSRNKARAIIELASAIVEKRLDLCELENLDNETAAARLRQLYGVGRWTAEYVLLRGLGRLDVFPADDVGARNNLRRWLGLVRPLDHDGVNSAIAEWREYGGLIYFHLLLKRIMEAGFL
jgi:DNA-3-methyladenine glycosylase II